MKTLREVEDNFRNFFETIEDIFIISSLDGRIIHGNKALVAKLEYPLEELINMNVVELYPVDQRGQANKVVDEIVKNKKEYCSLEVQSKSGAVFSVETRIFFGKWNQQDCIYRISKDMTQTIALTKELEDKLQELERFMSVNLDLLCTVDMEGCFLKVNTSWEELLGHTSLELKGRRFIDFVHPDDITSTLATMAQGQKGNEVLQFVNRYLSGDGTYYYIEWRSTPYEGIIYAAARDITERIKHEEAILEISNRDSLTNVYNRRYVFNRAGEVIEAYKRNEDPFSICILDIDYFKTINDNYGHQAGDYILKAFTETISKNLRPYDILGRYGGEEFILILTQSDQNESELVIERMLATIREETFIYKDNIISFTFSAGISTSNEIAKDEITIDKLVELADKRMYLAKKTGRNRIISK